jgi:LPS-assembly lipoprotein
MTLNACMRFITRFGLLSLSIVVLSACGFHLRGEMPLAQPLHSMYIQSIDPYGTLVKELEQSLKMSGVKLTMNASEAETILVILHDDTGQDLLSVGGTQQTRQYRLRVNVMFEVNDAHGRNIVPPQGLVESRVITVQSNQILGSSNEANLYFMQMRRTLASAIMHRISSHDITSMVNSAFAIKEPANIPATHVRKKHKT